MRVERWLFRLPLLLRTLLFRRNVERELDEELQYHIEQQFELNKAAGMSDAEAWREARRPFGNIETRKEYCRDHWVIASLDRLMRDLRQALRVLLRERTFSTGVVLLLVLGIGANVAAFSLVNGVLLKPLPYSDPQSLFVIREAIPERDTDSRAVNALHYKEWSACSCFEDLALAEYIQQTTLTGHGEPARLSYLRVTPNTFTLMGVSAQLGRTLLEADGEPGNETNVMITDRMWRNQFGADPGIIGQTVTFDSLPYTVVGVLPPHFVFHPYYAGSAEIDIFAPWLVEPLQWWSWTNNYSYTAIGRLAEGTTAQAALNELDTIQAGIATEHFTGDSAALNLEARLVPLQEWVTGSSRAALLLLIAAVGTAFLVACLNIANLMLVRATARAREAGIRSALGATRLAIFRSLFLESSLLAAVGTAGGIAFAWLAIKGISRLSATGLPRLAELQIDGTALAAAGALAIIATLVFGLLPAMRLTHVQPNRVLESGGRSVSESSGSVRSRQVLVTAEVALSVTLMIVGGLLLSSFLRLQAVERGFDSTNVVTADIGIPLQRYADDDARESFWTSLRDTLMSAPEVANAGFTSVLPLNGNFFGSTAIREGELPPAEDQIRAQYRFISEGYLDAIGIPLLRGRSLTSDDYDRGSAIVSERLAALLWGEQNPLGRRFHWNEPDNLFEVIGVVPDVPSVDLESERNPIVYRPFTATGDGTMTTSIAAIAVKMNGTPDTGAAILRRAVASLDPELALSRLQTMQQIEDASVGDRRFQLYLVGGFAAASLLIAAIGIYSVLAYAVHARHHELAMRLALGAHRQRVFSLVLRQGMSPVMVGVGLGILSAIAAGRAFSSLLFGVEPTDPTAIVSVVTLTLGTAVLASLIPARRAAATSVIELLRRVSG